MNLSSLSKELASFIKQQGDWAHEEWVAMRVTKKNKPSGEITTSIDEAIEINFNKFVLDNFPQHGFIGEEFENLTKEGEYQWHIDPIDGTHFFAFNVPLWTVTAALIKSGEPIVGVIYDPSSKQMYSAIKGEGAFVNNIRLHVASVNKLDDVNVVWDFVKHKAISDKELLLMNSFRADLVKNCSHVASLGNGSLSLAWLANGAFDVFLDPIRRPTKYVDIAAGLLIAQEAGAEVHYEKLKNSNDQVVVASTGVLKVMETLFKQYMPTLL